MSRNEERFPLEDDEQEFEDECDMSEDSKLDTYEYMTRRQR